MSYILEALKKAEQKKEQEERPRPLSFSSESHRKRGRPRLWHFLVTGALVLNAVVIAWWVTPWKSATSPKMAEMTSPQVATSGSPPAPGVEGKDQSEDRGAAALPAPAEKEKPPVKETAKPPVKEAKATKSIAAPPPAAKAEERASSDPAAASVSTSLASRQAPAVEKRRETPDVAERDDHVEKAAVEARGRPEAGAGSDGRMRSLADLPQEIRSGLPQFKISGHAYSPDPLFRVARVNEKIVQEGQELSPGLKVEEIVPDGIVFTSQGYRFKVGLAEAR